MFNAALAAADARQVFIFYDSLEIWCQTRRFNTPPGPLSSRNRVIMWSPGEEEVGGAMLAGGGNADRDV